MIDHHPIVSTFIGYVDKNWLQQVLPFLLEIGRRNVLLPYNTFVLMLQVGSKFNIICNSGLKPIFSSPWKLCHFSYKSFIHLEFFLLDYSFSTIKCKSKRLCYLLMRSLDFFHKTYNKLRPWTVDIPRGVIPGNIYRQALSLGRVLLSSFYELFLCTCNLKIQTLGKVTQCEISENWLSENKH